MHQHYIALYTHTHTNTTLTKKYKQKERGWREAFSLQAEQLHIKDKGCIGWDDAWVTLVAVGIVRCTGQLCPLPNAHLKRHLSKRLINSTCTSGNKKKTWTVTFKDTFWEPIYNKKTSEHTGEGLVIFTVQIKFWMRADWAWSPQAGWFLLQTSPRSTGTRQKTAKCIKVMVRSRFYEDPLHPWHPTK